MSLHGGTSVFVVSGRICKSCFTAFRAKARVAAFRLRPAGAIPAKTGSCNTGVGLRQPDMVRRELLIATSTFFTCGLLLQTWQIIQLRGIPGIAWRSVLFRHRLPTPGCTSKMTDKCDTGCNFSCHFFKVLPEVQHPV